MEGGIPDFTSEEALIIIGELTVNNRRLCDRVEMHMEQLEQARIENDQLSEDLKAERVATDDDPC